MPEFHLPFGHENELAALIRQAIGVGDWDPVTAITPQFNRDDGQEPWFYPETTADLDGLLGAPPEVLRTMCLMPFNDPNDPEDNWDTQRIGGELWCFPVQWYDHIPEGYEVTTINGRTEKFKRGDTDDDRRFGCLPYGFVRRATDVPQSV